MIPHYTKLIRTRATLNKKRAAAKAKAKAEAESKVQIVCVDGKQTGSVVLSGKKKEKRKRNTTSRKVKQSDKAVVAKAQNNRLVKYKDVNLGSKDAEKKSNLTIRSDTAN
jgi:hypothetical protein